MFRAASLLLSVTFAAVVHSTTPDNVSSRLMIRIPEELNKPDGYGHREALFGTPPYGGSLSQNVYYADSDLCEGNADTRIGYPRRENDETGRMKPWPSPFILMVDRGTCTFVQKVRNAQRAGASGVIIADNVCLCDDKDCMEKTNSQSCEPSEPIMADDGSGGDVSIPAFLMFKHDADEVKEVLKQDRPVQMEMSWNLPNPDNRVEYDLWTSPSDAVSLEFQRNFKDVAVALGERAYFTPHMYIYDGERSNCRAPDVGNMCYTLCTNNGRYCATDPDNDLDKGVSGADVVRESLRRICIWDYHGKKDGIGTKWWEYTIFFQRRCMNEEFFTREECIRDAYKHAKIDGDQIERCMIDSGGTEGNGDNNMLKKELENQRRSGVVVLPTAFVNNSALRGALAVKNIFRAICAGYATGTTPRICNQCSRCGDPLECVQLKGVCKKGPSAGESGGVSTSTFVFSLMFLVAVFSGVGIWYYKKSREEMKEQVRGILAEYMPLEDQETEGGSPMDFARAGGRVSLISS